MTQQNPPSPVPPPSGHPGMLNYAQPVSPRSDLRSIATRQRAIMFCILGYIGCVVLQLTLPPPINLMIAVGTLAVQITAVVFVFMLAISIYGTGVGVTFGILTLIPLINLIILLIVNGKATKILREHGIQVGLLGAKADQIPAPGAIPFK